MGALMATGLLDAGGRNACVATRSPGGHPRATTLIGLAMFAQYWYWYPLAYFIGFALAPAALIAVDGTLQPPAFDATCECRPSLFAHPPPAAAAAAAAVARAPAAVLSTTARAAERAAAKEAAKAAAAGGAGAMETDAKPAADAKPAPGAAGAAADAKPPPAEEPASFPLANPARVTPAQARFVRWDKGCRWAPLRPKPALPGFVVLRDTAPGQPVAYAAVGANAPPAAAPGGAPGEAAAAEEPAPPAAVDLGGAPCGGSGARGGVAGFDGGGAGGGARARRRVTRGRAGYVFRGWGRGGRRKGRPEAEPTASVPANEQGGGRRASRGAEGASHVWLRVGPGGCGAADRAVACRQARRRAGKHVRV